MWSWRRMEKIKWSDKVTNERVLECIGEKRTINNILCRKAEWIGHILRRNCLFHDATEGQMTEVKGVGRRTQFVDDLRNRRRYWELKEEAEDQNMQTIVYQSNIRKEYKFPKFMDQLISSILKGRL